MLPEPAQIVLSLMVAAKNKHRPIFALLLGLAFLAACSKRSLTVEFVFPDGFTGIAKVRSRQPSGITLVRTNDSVILVFPRSGVVDIKGKLPTVAWHKLVARFQGGVALPVLTPPNSVSDGVVALRPLGLKDNVEDWYLVGKADQVRGALSQKYGFELPDK